MTIRKSFQIEFVDGGLVTNGLAGAARRELRVRVAPGRSLDAARQMLQTFADYQLERHVAIAPGEKVQHGYWTVVLVEAEDGVLDAWEVSEDGERIIPGVAATLTYWLEQSATCQRAGASFLPPRADQKVAISRGVTARGTTVMGVRYRAPAHMSGWYMYTDEYDGNVSSMQVEHLFHITSQRPDLAKYLALPPGHRFTVGELTDEVTFDAKAAQS